MTSDADRLHASPRFVDLYNWKSPALAIGGHVPKAAVNNVLGHDN